MRACADAPELFVDAYPKPCSQCGSLTSCVTGVSVSVCRVGGPPFRFGDCPQTVVNALGTPSSVFVRPPGKLAIHGASLNDAAVAMACCVHTRAATLAESEPSPVPPEADYFWNYPDAGVDVLFDRCTHTVKKVILHTNFPG